VQAEIQITNWRLSRLTFLPSQRVAEPSSPSRVRCAAPNPRRALDRSGRALQNLSARKKGGSQEGKNNNNKDKIKIYLTSTGILMEGVCAQISTSFVRDARAPIGTHFPPLRSSTCETASLPPIRNGVPIPAKSCN